MHKNSVSEFVGSGHPDKIADFIADSVLDRALELDPLSKVACEVLVSDKLVVIAGEVSCSSVVDYRSLAIQHLESLGYSTDDFQFVINISKQSPDIYQSVASSGSIKSGDQGMVFGYACVGENFMPLSRRIARWLVVEAESLIDSNVFWWGRRDIKSLVDVENGTVKTIIFSINHLEEVSHDLVIKEVQFHLISKVKLIFGVEEIGAVYINSSGRFVVGGLLADSGLTNRKLMVDAFGSASRHGGGGYCGKDLSKVDRLGPYYARWICKNLVAAGIFDWVELRLIFSLGCSTPISYSWNYEFKSGFAVNIEKVERLVKSVFPQDINGIFLLFSDFAYKFSTLAIKGSFDCMGVPWEKLDKVAEIVNGLS